VRCAIDIGQIASGLEPRSVVQAFSQCGLPKDAAQPRREGRT
jgi:hypothetical protein